MAAVLVLAAAGWAYAKVSDFYPLTTAPGDDAAARASREASRTQSIVTTRASVLAALAGLGALVTIDRDQLPELPHAVGDAAGERPLLRRGRVTTTV